MYIHRAKKKLYMREGKKKFICGRDRAKFMYERKKNYLYLRGWGAIIQTPPITLEL